MTDPLTVRVPLHTGVGQVMRVAVPALPLRADSAVSAEGVATLGINAQVWLYDDVCEVDAASLTAFVYLTTITARGWAARSDTPLDGALRHFTEVAVDTFPPGQNPASKTVALGGLHLRAAPSLTGLLLLNMQVGDAATVYADPIEQVDGYAWARVTCKGVQGWAAVSVNGATSFADPVAPVFRLHAPFKQAVITSHFDDVRDYSTIAPDKKQAHEGQDSIDGLARDNGSDPMVHVGAAGTIVKVGFDARGYGNFCIVDFGDNFRGWYAHFQTLYVKEGQKVVDQEILGIMGSTGATSTAPHCHITLQHIGHGLKNYVVDDVVDPAPFWTVW